LAESSIVQEERRRQILHAAVRAFARKGYHACRVSDIATEAGVAYGLVYHYFGSKEALLEAIFKETWGAMLETVSSVERLDAHAPERLRKVTPDSDDDVVAAERAVVEIVVGGLAIERAAALA
jgi:TetR/AcrR family transcriptional regulator, fatty acid metabolism regulator protein